MLNTKRAGDLVLCFITTMWIIGIALIIVNDPQIVTTWRLIPHIVLPVISFFIYKSLFSYIQKDIEDEDKDKDKDKANCVIR